MRIVGETDLLEAGWTVSVNTVADSMRRQDLQGRKPKHSRGSTKQDKKAPKFGVTCSSATSPRRHIKWCGDIERHEVLSNRVEVGDLHRQAVAAAR